MEQPGKYDEGEFLDYLYKVFIGGDRDTYLRVIQTAYPFQAPQAYPQTWLSRQHGDALLGMRNGLHPVKETT
jgi:hypothetical protein